MQPWMPQHLPRPSGSSTTASGSIKDEDAASGSSSTDGPPVASASGDDHGGSFALTDLEDVKELGSGMTGTMYSGR